VGEELNSWFLFGTKKAYSREKATKSDTRGGIAAIKNQNV